MDDGSTDDTAKVLEDFRERRPSLNLIVLRQGKKGPAAARNTGAGKSSGEIMAFIDGDAIAHPDWLLEADRAFREKGIKALEGAILIPDRSGMTLFSHQLENTEGGRFQTCNMFFAGEAFASLGGFDESFSHPMREDADLAFSFMEKFGDIPFAKNVIVFHPARPDSILSTYILATFFFWDPLLYRKHPRLYLKYIKSPIGPLQCCFLYLLAAGCACLPAGWFHLMTVSFAGAIIAYLGHILIKVRGRRYTPLQFLYYAFFQLPVPVIKAASILWGCLVFKKFVWCRNYIPGWFRASAPLSGP